MTIGISTTIGPFSKGDTKVIDLADVTFINKLGIKYLELTGNEVLSKEVNEYMSSHNMGCSSTHANPENHDLSSENEIDRVKAVQIIKQNIDTIKKAGGNKIVIHCSDKPISTNREIRVENAIESLIQIVDYAVINDIETVIENLPSDSEFSWIGDSIKELDYVLNEVRKRRNSEDTIGICLDIGHAYTSGNLEEHIDYFKQNITELHMHDNLGKKKNEKWEPLHDSHFPPGLGSINWKKILGKLTDIKFNGLCTFEVTTHHLNQKNKQDTINMLRKMENFLQSKEYLDFKS